MKVGIQPLLPIGNFMNKRYCIEMDFPDDSSIADNFKSLNEAVMAVHMMEYPMFYKDGKPLYIPEQPVYQAEEEKQVKEPVTKLSKEEKQKKCITDTTTIEGSDGLKSFAFLVSKNPHLQETYDNHFKKLTDGL